MPVDADAHRALMEHVVACRACPRLVAHCEAAARDKVRRYRDWDYWGKPVPAFGSPDARLCIVGLAPAAHGGNRTGRMFTGDPSADFLANALHAAGFATLPTSQHRGDGQTLVDAYITAAVKCAPPDNKPTAQERAECLPYLVDELRLMPNLRAVLALGKLGFDAYLRAARAMGLPRPRGVSFGHGVRYTLGGGFPTLFASYHPSPHNTYTGRLTHDALVAVLHAVRGEL